MIKTGHVPTLNQAKLGDYLAAHYDRIVTPSGKIKWILKK